MFWLHLIGNRNTLSVLADKIRQGHPASSAVSKTACSGCNTRLCKRRSGSVGSHTFAEAYELSLTSWWFAESCTSGHKRASGGSPMELAPAGHGLPLRIFRDITRDGNFFHLTGDTRQVHLLFYFYFKHKTLSNKNVA